MTSKLEYSCIGEVVQLVLALRTIATHRQLCHEHDADCGHKPRTFDVEDVKLMEWQARIALAEWEKSSAAAVRANHISNLHAEALAEIKATVDGESDQPVKDIIYGLLAEIEALNNKEKSSDNA